MREGLAYYIIHNRKKIVLGATGVLSFVLFLVLLGISSRMGNSLAEQSMAERWSEKGGVAQISCFFSPNANISPDTFKEFEHSLDSMLLEASVTPESDNPGARLWADCYSAEGKITLSNGKSYVEADAVGIGGDFFLFHPAKLLCGAYFSGNDINQDYCVIDQDAAWQLFGSNNVAGMMVYIAGRPHVVTGVIERESGRMEKAAGLDGTRVYVSYQTLQDYGSHSGINSYEIVMPDPVGKFALNHVKESLGSNEQETEILENSTRFGLLNRLKLIGSFGTRSMNGKAIIYPYWENIARGYEDIIGVLTLFMLLFLLYALVLGTVFFVLWWKHKSWTVKGVFLKQKDRVERYFERGRMKRMAKKPTKRRRGYEKME